jgi:hypothetical protein
MRIVITSLYYVILQSLDRNLDRRHPFAGTGEGGERHSLPWMSGRAAVPPWR